MLKGACPSKFPSNADIWHFTKKEIPYSEDEKVHVEVNNKRDVPVFGPVCANFG